MDRSADPLVPARDRAKERRIRQCLRQLCAAHATAATELRREYLVDLSVDVIYEIFRRELPKPSRKDGTT